jgi:predicted ABC-type transport system involved in lysophospholipase L1 biosynthesis ATPase subunit
MALLELNGIAKHFGAIEALKGVDMSLESGEVVGLMGDNGAGKSTLVKIIAGNFPPSEGEIRMGGDIKHFHKPVDARAEGIEVVYQDLALCNNLTAAANVFLGREVKRRLGPFRLLDYPAMYARAAELFKELKSETRPRDLVKQMSGGQRQAVAIARKDRAHGRADGRDQRAPGRRGARPHPPLEGSRDRRGSDQPSHARCFCRQRSRHRHAARCQGCRQGRRADLARGGDGTHHRSDPHRLN